MKEFVKKVAVPVGGTVFLAVVFYSLCMGNASAII